MRYLGGLFGPVPAVSSLPRARWVLMGLFALNGLVFSSWLARLPAVRDALDLDAAQLGGLLLAGSVGALAMVTVSGALVTRYGGRAGLLLSTLGVALAYVLLGLGPTLGSLPLVAAGIFLTGVSFALGNVPLNVETAAVERRMGRTVLPQFHAAFSIGAVLGSVVGAAASALEVSLLAQFTVTAVVAVVWRLLSIPHVLVAPVPPRVQVREVVDTTTTTSPSVPGARGRVGLMTRRRPAARIGSALDAWREPRTLLVGVVIMAAALSEGSANDWLSIAVVDGFDRTEAVGAVVFGLFVAAMTVVRLLGTRVIDRYGRVPVLRVSGVVSLGGLLLFGFAPTLELATVGVAAWGFGAALAVPIGIAAASDDPLRAAGRVAVVSAFASVASLAAPPLLGLAAQHVGARHALVLIVGAMVVSVALARQVARPAAAVDVPEVDVPVPAAAHDAGTPARIDHRHPAPAPTSDPAASLDEAAPGARTVALAR